MDFFKKTKTTQIKKKGEGNPTDFLRGLESSFSANYNTQSDFGPLYHQLYQERQEGIFLRFWEDELIPSVLYFM